MKTTSELTETKLFRSVMPVCCVHIKARSPEELVELPTTAPISLSPSARLEFPPESTPKSCIPVAWVHKKARRPRGPLEYPTTVPLLLILRASLDISPGSVPRSRILPSVVQRTARSPAALADVPAISSKSLMSHALL